MPVKPRGTSLDNVTKPPKQNSRRSSKTQPDMAQPDMDTKIAVAEVVIRKYPLKDREGNVLDHTNTKDPLVIEMMKLEAIYDVDGDGIGPLERCMMNYDLDGNGEFTPGEVKAIIFDMKEEEKKVQGLQKVIFLLVFLFVFAMSCMLGITLLANEQSKESHVDGAYMTTKDGKSAVQTEPVESMGTLWDTPKHTTETLSKMKTLVVYRCGTTACAAGDAWYEAAYDVAGAYKPAGSTTEAYLETGGGNVVYINGETKKGTIKIETSPGTIEEFKVSDIGGSARRRLADFEEAPRLLSRKEYELKMRTEAVQDQDQDERRLGFFSALQTSGSFVMMQAGGF